MAVPATVYLFLLSFLLIVKLFNHCTKQKAKFLDSKNVEYQHKQLPGPLSFPGIGGIWRIILLGYHGSNYNTYHALCQQYGKIMGFQGGIQNYLITEDYESIKEILTSSNWVDRFPKNRIYNQHTFGQNFGLLFSYGEQWKETRRFVTRTLGEDGFGDMTTADRILTEETEYFLNHINDLLTKSDILPNVNGLFSIPTLNINWRLIAGQRFDYGDKNLLILLKLIKKGVECEFGRHPVFNFPFLDRIPGLSPIKKFNRVFYTTYEHINKLMCERRNGNVFEKNKSHCTNLIDKFLQKIEENKQTPNTVFTDKQLIVTVTDLLLAATDTTATMLSHAILYMLLNPQVQEKVQEEVTNVVGNRKVTVYDRHLLPYTVATTLEIQRMGSVIPVLSRTCTADTNVGGYTVKKGVFALLNVIQLHHDPEIWKDPYNFRPERFLDVNNCVIKDHKVLAFGGGRRICPGQVVANLTFFHFFTSLLQKYNFKIPENSDISIIPISGFTNSPSPYAARIHLRSSKVE